MTHTVNEPGRQTPVVAETDVLVVGGGPPARPLRWRRPGPVPA
jgi:hypothetical protein